MTLLKDILYKVSLTSTTGDMEVEVKDIVFDSRKVSEGSAFVAVPGTQVDGHDFIDKALELGATSVICEKLPHALNEGITYVQVVNSAKALGIMASNYFGNPSEQIQVVAITGTNGKTTTATLLHQLFMRMGYSTGLLSTVENKINEQVIPATHTTPDAVAVQALLRQMVDEGCTHCFMEASSHAIVQERIAGLKLAGAVFTNITHDHLDYHGTFDAYIKAKKQLFDELPKGAFALVNGDDKRGTVMLQNSKASHQTFALKSPADFKAKIISNTLEGLELDINGKLIWFRMIGAFNAYNLLGVLGVAVLLGEEEDEVLRELSGIPGAKGRFDRISIAGITAIVDYAHTPDALDNVLKTINGVRTGGEQLITIVGCGGNRDTTKRPIMAKLAVQESDKAILTSDNPRFEDPEQILKDMQAGIGPSEIRKTLTIVDRKEAIKTACMLSQKGDIILIAGKGHEDYQEIKGVKHHFDDAEIVTEFLQQLTQN
ncbi:UDP-N-acetylmuramoyl-L-alanyl-D-glutamate--2,6-diaminopimelate ligase [Algoriphagus halophytocola]|uniref:UDP-N-acetylmuramoyl-L-alanyl-D-glutamate--2,6-diaminopimelate ligase n=1 Tax=Algoriphagus halophytocola TaxID=2991499 RepID=A0ABY6MEM4_9BACT|nr:MULTISPECIES: UDP-N-acetylmuramoyl-L-alanyl-D-glutamate--2,6-diaminopimelate ligase [unclassified Algoriphagus]UZD21076.1 UDP-N-acetylmuramoyl-L-alanyl-D-glutamate--2,6-diaminopimelate ligase [Algoriphagus sp. TR-M5]WBL42242.1 UDP-N-acetylmuramoyl-L-alanyl-D-glutamate--2,6-diaminopimelate ligase [Algoriphagus sp. TR-M9]